MILDVSDPSHVAAARRATSGLCEDIGLDNEQSGRATLIVSEMATNLLKHAQRGQLVLSARESPHGIEIISLDRGPGVKDVPRAMTDGYSTAGSMGGGLGIIGRQADEFEIFSRDGTGTVMMARVHVGTPEASKAILGSVLDVYPGETMSGDGWTFAEAESSITLCMVDGSGHGPFAHAAAATAINVFKDHASDDCVSLMDRIHRAMIPTRGGAVAIARMDLSAKTVRFVGIGNITAALVGAAEVKRMVSHNGTAGQLNPRIREFTYPFAGPAAILLHSDGLSSRWDFGAYPGLAMAHPSLISGVLFRDSRRGRDDACVTCMRAA